MLKSIEAVVEPSGEVRLLEPVNVSTPQRAILTILDMSREEDAMPLLSERSLAADWSRPEEERAWQHLQKAK